MTFIGRAKSSLSTRPEKPPDWGIKHILNVTKKGFKQTGFLVFRCLAEVVKSGDQEFGLGYAALVTSKSLKKQSGKATPWERF
ncbi:hypothetical protein A33Q_3936 [Indibacter alkaliphilus LW1]|uniref:Uncharacterized protein n=1 Tax=Indibacter alkaliphilus (strain CCUG 57479 / KCTC 22604 / LW1) TaxID=1189612 RepID=S2D703_INDAL|nr:hypothetical protein [Indibacter alkaliphilus]EOZ92845.1 hypothetical protein A33Q_3936 [Indibacter alkaliphilus LW1]